MGKYDSLIPQNNPVPQAPAGVRGAVVGVKTPTVKPIQTPTAKPTTSNKYAALIPETNRPAAVRGAATSTKTMMSQPTVSQETPVTVGGKYSKLIPPKEPNYFATVDELGNSLGFSDMEKDPSGRPYFAYRKPGDTATTTDYTRVATKFDPRTPAKVTRDDFYNPRAVENRAMLREAMGGAYDDELDHKIAVALSGSNNKKNLRPIPADENTDSPIISRLQQEVINGQKSLFEAQVELARLKGIDIPWTPEVKKQAEADRFGRFLGNLQEYVVKPKAIDINALPKGETIGPLNPNNKKISASAAFEMMQKPVFDPSSKAGIAVNTVRGIPAATGEFAKDVAQSIARSVGTVGVTAQRAFAKGANAIGIPLPALEPEIQTNQNKYYKFIFGGKPVKDLPTFARSATKGTEELASKVTGEEVKLPNSLVGYPLAVGSVLLDLTGWGGKKAVRSFADGTIPEKFFKYVAKTSNPKTLEATYKRIGVTDPAVVKALTEATKDLKTVDEVKQALINFGKADTTPRATMLPAATAKPRTPTQILAEFDANKNGVIDPGEMVKAKPEPLIRGPVTTSILDKIADRPSISKQFILDLTNGASVKQSEKDLIREALNDEGDKVDVPAFIKKVEAELLPLKVNDKKPFTEFMGEVTRADKYKYEGITLPPNLRGEVKNYKEHVYQSPVKTSAGDVHFADNNINNYFGHTRIEDLPDNTTRRVIEVQSDLYQKGNLERELKSDITDEIKKIKWQGINKEITPDEATKRIAKLKADTMKKEVGGAKLQQYTNPTAHFRMVREEIKRAAQDGKERLLFPTGETAMKIEGLGETSTWLSRQEGGFRKITPENLEVGLEIKPSVQDDSWIITDVLVDGKFKAVPLDKLGGDIELFKKNLKSPINNPELERMKETFDISGKVDTNNPIYKFYEKDLSRYLTSKHDAKLVTDKQGVSWYEVPVKKEAADQPVQAFKKIKESEVEDVYESTVGREIRFESTEADIDRVFRRIFNPGEITVQGRKNMPNAGEFVRMRDERDQLRNHINLLTVNGKMSKDVALHEAGHAIFNMFKTHAYRKALLNRVKKMGVLTNYKKYKSYETDDLKAEEWLMDDFADWWNAKIDGPKYKGFFGRLWTTFSQFLKDLRRKFTRADKLYQDIVNKRRPEPTVSPEDSVKVKIRRQEMRRNGVDRSEQDVTPKARNTDVTPEMRERVANNEAEMASKRRQEVPSYLARGGVTKETPVVENLFGSFKSALNPLRAVDQKTREIFKQWNSDIILGKERVRQEIADVSKEVPTGMNEIDAYEAGGGKYQKYIKALFDDLQREANARGLETGYVENYVPHVYAENPKQQEEKILRYLEGKGLNEDQARAYMNEQPLKIEEARRLKLSPTFDKERLFATYAEAKEKAGLMPKYKSVADLAGYYVAEMEKSVANRRLLDDLWDAGKIKPDVSAPTSWSILNPQFSPNSTFKAPAQTARVINGIFPDTNIPSFMRGLFSVTGSLSSKLQNLTLSAGVPFTNFNYFSLGQMIKEITSGNLSAATAFIRANSNTLSMRYFEEKKPIIRMMGEEGIDLSGRVGRNGERLFKDLVGSKEWTKAFGKGFDNAFSAKTFGSFMPQMYIGVFENVYNKAIAKGMSEFEARKLAGDIVKNNFGLLSEDFARSKVVQDMLSTIFFAPKFREGVLRTLTKTGLAGFNFARSAIKGGPANPAYRKNLQLLAGMIISYGLYQLINKQTSGQYTWENPDGRKFAIRIPTKGGDVLYVEYMPSFFAFPRMLATGAMALAEGDFKMATQKFGGLLSTPVKLITDVIGNEDYFGREIYKDTDDTSTKAKKVAIYLGLSASHPYIREIVNQINDKNPLYQSISTMLELPFKFSSLEKEAKAAYYKRFEEVQKEEARAKEKFLPTFKEIQDIIAQGNTEEAQRRVDALSEEEYAIYKSLKSSMKAKETKAKTATIGSQIYEKVQAMKEAGQGDDAIMVYINSLSEDEYKAYKSAKKSLE